LFHQFLVICDLAGAAACSVDDANQNGIVFTTLKASLARPDVHAVQGMLSISAPDSQAPAWI
jgi:hypothetical protein